MQGVSIELEILLATWNGAAWLPAQLESVLSQLDDRSRILVRDDGSTDGTQELLTEWVARYPQQIVLLPDDGRRLGACGNFAALLALSTAPQVMLCDQDDVWSSGKIAMSRVALERLERIHGSQCPLLVHGDPTLVGHNLEPWGRTLSQAIRINLDHAGVLRRQLIQNSATGCTMLMNRALINAVCPIPGTAVMHDWWIALVASAIGHVAVISGHLLDYRQHSKNTIGSKGMRLDRLFARFSNVGAVRSRILRAANQSKSLLDRHSKTMSDASRQMCMAFVRLPSQSWFRRRLVILRHGFWMSGATRNLGMIVLL